MRSCDVIRELWEVRCEKWNCDELGCDKLWWVVMRSGPVRSGAVMSWDVISTAPCHAKGSQEALCILRLPHEASRGPAAPTRAAAPPGGSMDCACHAKGRQEAVCTAPATRSQPRPSGAHARRSSSRRLCVLRRPRERQPGWLHGRRPRAPQLYCACHAKGSQEALCTAPATRSRPTSAHARRSSSRRLCGLAGRKAARKLCILRLPHEASCGPAAPTRAAAPCVLRRPRERQPGSSLYCACHVKPAAAQRRPRTPQLLQEALCTAPATRKAARNARRRLSIQEALCILRLPRERQPGSSLYCACRAKWVSEWGREGGREGGSEGVREWGSEWVRAWVREWWSEGVTEWGSEGVGVRERGSEGLGEWGSEGVRERGSEGVREWWSEGVREWGSEGVREWGSEGVREWGSEGGREWWVWVRRGGSGGGGGGGAEPRRDPSEKQEPHTVMWGTTHTHTTTTLHTQLCHTTFSLTTLSHTHNSLTQLSHTTLSQHTTTLSQLFHTHNLLTHTTAILSHTSKLRPPICVAGMALGDIDHHSMWQARHLFHSILCGSCGVWWHQPSFCVVPLRRGCLCGRRGIWKHRPPFCVAGVALGDIDHRPGTWRHQHRGALGSCWRRGCLCGRRSIDLHSVWRGVWWHQPSFCGSRGAYFTGLALVARLVPVGAAAVCVAGVAFGSIDLHSVWQAWHLATSDFTLCGNWRQVWQFRARSCGIAVHFVWEIKSKRSKVDVVAFTDIEVCATFRWIAGHGRQWFAVCSCATGCPYIMQPWQSSGPFA